MESPKPWLTIGADDLYKQTSQWQFEAILEAFDTISRWIDKDFPEVSFHVEFNDDSQNPVKPRFIIKSRVMTDKTMDRDDQRLIKNELYITKEAWEDSITMRKWIAQLVPSFKKSISEQINDWYARKKVEGTAL